MLIKANQAGLLRNAKAVVTARHPVESKKKKKREHGHGRLEAKLTRIYRLDVPAQLGLFGAHTLICTKRQTQALSGPRRGERSAVETVYHASSVRMDEAHGVEYFADAVRNQWSIEAKYHARRDGTFCEDVRTRRYSANVIGAMLLARSATFVFFARSGTTNCQEFKEGLQANPTKAFRLVICNNY